MIKLIFLIAFLLLGTYTLKADESISSDQDFMKELDTVKNPFEDGLPKPVLIVVPTTPVAPVPVVAPPKPKPVAPPVELPELNLQGVMVGEGMHEAIIDDKIVSLLGFVKGVQLISVSKQGVGLLYKHKKFFLKVD